MSAILNRNGVDQISIEFLQTGRSETECTFNQDTLDGQKEYMFCVDSWNVPLNGTPLNRYRGQELFTIFKRNAGTNIEVQSNIAIADGNGLSYTIVEDFLDVQSLIASLSNFARGFRQRFETGIADLRLYGGLADAQSPAAAVVAPLEAIPADNLDIWIAFTMDLDGRIVVQLSSNFINHFVIRFTRIGSELLSLHEHLTAVTHSIADEADNNNDFLVEDGEFLYYAPSAGDFLSENNTIQIGGNTRSKKLKGRLSLYQTFDCRLKCTLESHLPINSNMFVQDGIQKNTRYIAEVFFDKILTTTMNLASSEVQISSKAFSGQYPLIKKSDVYKQWHKLTMVYGLRFFRFQNYITYRVWDVLENVWIFKQYPLEVDENNYIDFTLRFISEA